MNDLTTSIKYIITQSSMRSDINIANIIIALEHCYPKLQITKQLIKTIKHLLPEQPNKLDNIKQQCIAITNTSKWDIARQWYITASLSGQCAGLMGKISRLNCLIEKVTYGSLSTCPETYWTDFGHRFEPVVKNIYTGRTGNHVHDVGLVCHDKIGYLAASTDGICLDQNGQIINIEIKSVTRNITGKIKKQYQFQVQHQMECLDLDKTHFIEARFSESDEPFEDVSESDTIGQMHEFYNTQECRTEYHYNECKEESSNGLIYLRTIHWKLLDYNCQVIERDPSWLSKVIKGHYQFWKDVCYYRSNDSGPEEFDKLLFDKDQALAEKRKKRSNNMTVCML